MHIQLPHKITKEKAVKRIKDALEENRAKLLEQAKIEEERWEGDTLNFAVELQGKSITGSLAVTDTEYILDAKLPLLWRMFEGRIQAEVEKQVRGMS